MEAKSSFSKKAAAWAKIVTFTVLVVVIFSTLLVMANALTKKDSTVPSVVMAESTDGEAANRIANAMETQAAVSVEELSVKKQEVTILQQIADCVCQWLNADCGEQVFKKTEVLFETPTATFTATKTQGQGDPSATATATNEQGGNVTLTPTLSQATATKTSVLPTATKVPTNTFVPATATSIVVQPSATSRPPTATLVPPTATSRPPTATSIPPTSTSVPTTATLVPPTPEPQGPWVVCHKQEDAPGRVTWVTKEIKNLSSYLAHIAHGDSDGACQ